MVTEILRPIEGTKTSTVVLHPNSTDNSDLYKLLNEEIADDDSTYIELPDVLQSVTVGFDINALLAIYLNIKTCKIIFRAKIDSIDNKTGFYIGLMKWDNSNNKHTTAIGGRIAPTSTNWETYSYDIDVNTIISVIESDAINGHTSLLGKLYVNLGQQATGGKSSGSGYYTQAYMEITYDDGTIETSETIYLKENDTWTSVPCTIFQKQNGSWVKTDSSIFENGDRFTIQQIT